MAGFQLKYIKFRKLIISFYQPKSFSSNEQLSIMEEMDSKIILQVFPEEVRAIFNNFVRNKTKKSYYNLHFNVLLLGLGIDTWKRK